MPAPSSPDIRKAVKLVRDAANRKFGKDWSLIISNERGMQIEGRHTDGRVVQGRGGGRLIQSIVWIDGRVESRTTVAKGS